MQRGKDHGTAPYEPSSSMQAFARNKSKDTLTAYLIEKFWGEDFKVVASLMGVGLDGKQNPEIAPSVFIRPDAGSTTFAHELGHALGVHHFFGTDEEMAINLMSKHFSSKRTDLILTDEQIQKMRTSKLLKKQK
jgi:hypothetical protein